MNTIYEVANTVSLVFLGVLFLVTASLILIYFAMLGRNFVAAILIGGRNFGSYIFKHGPDN